MAEIDDVESDCKASSQMTLPLNYKLFKLKFELTEQEEVGLKEAFRLFKDVRDDCISLHELWDFIKDKEEDAKAIENKLFFQMIKRITEFPEMRNDPRINFDKFKVLVLKAMNMRRSRHQVQLLFDVMDTAKMGRIMPHDLKKAAQLTGKDMNLNKCREIISMNSSNRQYVQFEDFLHIMT